MFSVLLSTEEIEDVERGEEEEEVQEVLSTTKNNHLMPPVTVSTFTYKDTDKRTYVCNYLSLDSSFQEDRSQEITIELAPDFMSVRVTYPVHQIVYNSIHISKIFNKAWDESFMTIYGKHNGKRLEDINDMKK